MAGWAGAVIAQADVGGILPLWAELGVGGLLFVAFVVGWIVPGKLHEREVRRADRLEEENGRIRDTVETRIVPLVTEAIAVLERARADRAGDRRSDRSYGAQHHPKGGG